MKKIFIFIVGIVVGLGAYAQDFESGDLTYTVLSPDDKTCAVTGMTVEDKSSITSLTIPPTVFYDGEEYTVTEIGADACTWLSNMIELNLPETLKTIGNQSFLGCESLQRLIIPDSVTFIGGWAFENSINLKYVELGKSVKDVYNHPFYGAPIVAVNLKAETPFRFEGDWGFTYEDYFPTNPLIGVPENSVDIYKQSWSNARIYAYKPANSISFDREYYSINPGETVKLEYNVDPEESPVSFYCNMPGVSISDEGVLTVSNTADSFSTTIIACTLNGLTATCELSVAALPRFNADGLEFSIYYGEEKEVCLTGFSDFNANLVIPETIEYEGETYTVAYIKDNFMRWTGLLEELTIPATVKSIGNYSFQNCNNLSKVTIADSNEPLEVGMGIFTSCGNLLTFYLGRDVIGSSLDTYGCGINRVILGMSVTEVPDETFAWWGSSISVVESLNPIPPTLFGDCFSYNRDQIKVIVPEEYVEVYREAWGDLGFGSIEAEKEVTELAFAEDAITIYAGEETRLPLIVTPEDAVIMWSSSDKYLVNVSDGYVWVSDWNASGEVVITATALNGLSADCHVTVEKWFSISQNPITLALGNTQQLGIEKSERFAVLDIPVIWGVESGNDVVTIDPETGEITAIAYGNARIYAMAYIEELGTSVYAYSDVKVAEYPTSVTPEFQEITATRGETPHVDLTIEPNDEYVDKTIHWTNNNPDIAEIFQGWDGEYYVNCYEAGTAYIYGLTENGLTIEIKVNVIGKIEDLTFNTNKIYVAPEGTFQLEYTIVPEDAQQVIRFESGDEGVATVDPVTGLVTGVNFGNTDIYAYAENGWSWSVPVQVCILPESVKFVGSSDYEGAVNQWTNFNIEFTPNDDDICKEIQWTAENPDIVYIDSNANSFYGQRLGTTAIKGVAANGDVLEGTITIGGIQILVNGEISQWNEVNLGTELKLDIQASSDELLENIIFSSNNPEVVTVTEDGIATAVGVGTTWIIAESRVYVSEYDYKSYYYDIQITVKPDEGIAFSTNNVTLTQGNWIYVSIIRGENEGWSDITWKSSDENVVAITWSSNYEAQLNYVGPGQATVSATDENGNVATCEVHCYGIEFTPSQVRMDQNSTFQLEAKALPEIEGAEPSTIYWETYNDEVVSVDENGMLTSHDSVGFTTIRAYTYINGYYVDAYCEVEVIRPITQIRLSENTIEGVKGDEVQVTATITPDDATYQDLKWVSSDEEVAIVDQNGLVTMVGGGIALIQAWATDGSDVFGQCEVIVSVPATRITLNETSISAEEGAQIQLIATVTPEDATNVNLLWESSDESVATVDQTGLVTIHRVGSATIYVWVVGYDTLYAKCDVYGTTGIDGILSDDLPFDIYNLNGILIKKDATSADFKQLTPDFYLIKKGDVVVKIKR